MAALGGMTVPMPEFELQRLPLSKNGHDAWSRVHRGGRVVLDCTDGTDLEAQVSVAGGHLLFLTYDSPFDEGLHLIYLDDADHLRDEARIGFMYPHGIGLLGDVRRVDECRVEFDFYGSWRVTVDPLGYIGPLRDSAPPGVRRPWRRWLARKHLRFEALPT